MNKRQQGQTEIFLLSKFPSSFEDSFLVFRAQKLIEDDNSGISLSSINSEYMKSLNYKPILNNIKNLMMNIVFKYIDFWTIINQSENIDNHNLDKINCLGNIINKLNENLKSNIDIVQKVDLYDLELVKLYYNYLLDILNDHSNANKYKSKIIELEHTTHQFNEDNIFNLNYKEMIRSEDYKYIVINCSPEKLGIIKNLSLLQVYYLAFQKMKLLEGL